MRSRIATLSLCLALAAPTAAVARPHMHRHKHHAARHRAIAAPAPVAAFPFGRRDLVAEARRWIGTNPTGRRSLWCARFMNFVLARAGLPGTGSDAAKSFLRYGARVAGPEVGAIAVLARRGGGHVGVVSGVDAAGNPILVSGNYRRQVAEAAHDRRRVLAYVKPIG